MTERKNIPAVIAIQTVAVLSDQRGSLVGRGLAALRKDNGALYRQTRLVFDRQASWFGRGSAVDPAISSAFKIFQQLSNENFGKAFYPLSILYGDRRDVEEGKNHAQYFAQLAFEWCFANKTNQDVELWCDLGRMYDKGDGVEQSYENAVKCFRLAAEQGNAQAQWHLGDSYSEGHGVPQDYEEAVKWILLAAEQGNVVAQSNLWWLYEVGQGVPYSHEEAVKWC